MNNENSATANAILVVLLVIVVGFIVWFVTTRNNSAELDNNDTSPALEINLGDNSSDSTGGGTENQ